MSVEENREKNGLEETHSLNGPQPYGNQICVIISIATKLTEENKKDTMKRVTTYFAASNKTCKANKYLQVFNLLLLKIKYIHSQ